MYRRILIIMVIITLITYIAYINVNNSVEMASTTYKYNASFPDNRIKIMTFNIHHGIGLDGRLNLDRVSKIIYEANVDIIGLNEVDKGMIRTNFQNQVKVLAEKLDMNYAFGPTIRLGIGSFGNAVLSKYPIVDAINYRLPGKLGSEPRGLLSTIIDIPGEQDITVVVTHLSLIESDRQKQVKWIIDFMKKIETPGIVMGDFNAEFESLPGLKDLLGNIKNYPSNGPIKGLDCIFSNHNFELLNSYTIDSQASDHLPVVVEIK